MQDNSKEFNEFFKETYLLFRKVATYTAYLEKLDANYVNIAAINEIRGVLFHLYGYLDEKQANKEFIAANYIEAKEHLIRAYFDLFSGICTVITDIISNYGEIYSIEVITTLYPDYYTLVTPELFRLFEKISKARATRRLEVEPLSHLDEYDKIINQLKDWHTTLLSLIPAFEKKKQEIEKKKKEEREEAIRKSNKDIYWKIGIAIATLILGFVLNHFVDFSKSQKQIRQPNTQIKKGIKK